MKQTRPSDSSRDERQLRDAYGLALLLVLSSTLGMIAVGTPMASPLAATAAVLQLIALIVTLRVSGVRRSRWRLGSIVIVIVFLAAAFATSLEGTTGGVVGISAWILLTTTTIAAIVKRLATYDEVNLQLVMGLLVVYILLGVMFGLAYLLADTVSGPAFTSTAQGVSGALYFSFVTLSTLGYGDIAPLASVARSLAVAEAIVGQLYLVSVVSLAVSRLGVRKKPARVDDVAAQAAGEMGEE